jgi:AsmA protein
MARYARRLILWAAGGVGALLVLAVLAIAALLWWVDPNVYRSRIQTAAGEALGRPVTLTGDLRWNIGRRIAIESRGGSIANAPGFGAEPFARWEQLRFGLAALPLLQGQILIDRVEIDGLQLDLQRDAAGMNNWQFGGAAQADAASTSPAVQLRSIALEHGRLRYRDAASGADWRLSELQLGAELPEDLNAAVREFPDVKVAARLFGGPLAPAGLAVSFAADRIRHDGTTDVLEIPAFHAMANEATLDAGLKASLGEAFAAQGSIELKVPSLRELLAALGLTPPPMQDASTLGRLRLATQFATRDGSLTADSLAFDLDDTKMTGSVSVPVFSPFALRFDLVADRVNMDRYMEPDDVKSEPFALPLAQLKSLNAKGALRLQSATFAGVTARDLRVDVQ